MARASAGRGGFTLVELLVVIAIIGILVALLLPAIQAAREAGRRAKCSNNLKQVVLAVHLFEDKFNELPKNRYGDYDAWTAFGGPYENSSSYSWLSAILPYLEQNTLYQSGDMPNVPLNTSKAIGQPVLTFHCPSDTINTLKVYPERSHYMRTGILVGLTNYKGVQGANFCWGDWANGSKTAVDCKPWFHGDGIFYPMDWQSPRTLAVIEDGTSHTFMVGEDIWNMTRATCDTPCYGLGFAWAHPVEACATGAIPPNARRPTGVEYAEDDWTGHNGFRSKHPTGLQFGNCDGSVRFVRDSIPLGLYRAHCTISSKEPGAFDN